MNVILTMPAIVDEKLTTLPKDAVIKRQTKRIVQQAKYPVISHIFGSYLNPHCHIQECYSEAHFNLLINSQN